MIGINKDIEYNSKVYSSLFLEYNITPLDIRRKIRLLNTMFDLKVTGQHIKLDQNSTYNLRSSNKIKFEQKKIWLRVFDIYKSPRKGHKIVEYAARSSTKFGI